MAAILPRGTTHGTFPWNIPHEKMKVCKSEDPYFGGDKAERIAVCLGCKMPECNNCFGRGKPKKYSYQSRTERKMQMHLKITKFKELYEAKLSSDEIRKTLGISESTFSRYKQAIQNI